VYGPEKSLVRGPYTQEDATEGTLRTPIVRGETVTVEVEVPAGVRSALDLTIGRVVHGYRPLHPFKSSGSAKSGACNIDVACDEADPWQKQVRSVAGYGFTRDEDALICTGALVNNTAEDKTPYFLTAEHCVQSERDAQSMVFYWNYQNETCRTPGSPESGQSTDDDPLNQTSSGAILRARYGNWHEDRTFGEKPDLTLVEIDDEIPSNYQLYFSGWSREEIAPQQSVTIHHPDGDGKRISFDRDPATVSGYGENGRGDMYLRIGNWELGTTEKGSSGAPLFNQNKKIVGVLSGGAAGCDGDGDIDDNDRPDWYGRIAPGFESGDYQNTTLADFLDPTNSGAMEIDGQNLVNDTQPPARPVRFRVATVSSDSVTLRWTAPGDNGTAGTADQYLLRYRSDGPITTRNEFETAREISNVPIPKPADTPQSTTIAVEEDSSYYFALVAVDKVGNASPVASIQRDVTPVPSLKVTTAPYPNPTRGSATLRFVVDESQPIRAELYDALGRRIQVLYDEEPPAYQKQTISTNLSRLSSGVYFVRIRGRSAARTRQISVVR
jgi:lysyl endopeptidase